MKFLCFLVLTLGLIATAPFAVEAKQNSHSKTTVEKKKNRDISAKERATKKHSSERAERKKEASRDKKERVTARRDTRSSERAERKKEAMRDKKERETARREKRSYDRKKQEEARADRIERRRSAKNRREVQEERRSVRHARVNDRKSHILSRREAREQASRKRHSYALSRKSARIRGSRTRKELASLDYIQPIEPKKISKQTSRKDTVWMDDGNELAGKASWYGKDFHGGKTASGLRYDMYTFTAAHRTLPLGTVVKVTTLDEGKSVVVCVTDRGPYVRGRVIDLSYAAATQLGLENKGIGDVNLEIICDKNGKPLKKTQAFFVQYKAQQGNEKAGPFKEFADACAMQEALRQAHPDAAVILDSAR